MEQASLPFILRWTNKRWHPCSQASGKPPSMSPLRRDDWGLCGWERGPGLQRLLQVALSPHPATPGPLLAQDRHSTEQLLELPAWSKFFLSFKGLIFVKTGTHLTPPPTPLPAPPLAPGRIMEPSSPALGPGLYLCQLWVLENNPQSCPLFGLGLGGWEEGMKSHDQMSPPRECLCVLKASSVSSPHHTRRVWSSPLTPTLN